jgi:phytoene desaturase
MMNKEVTIVGTGLGGLSTGLRLVSQGYEVRFLEKNGQAGGRLNQLKKDGFTFDMGPSFFSMPYEFEELMKDCNMSMPFDFVELDPLYTVNFRDNDKKFSLYKNLDMLNEQFESIEPNFKSKMTAYLKSCEKLYNDTVDIVIKQNFDNVQNYVKALMQVNPNHLPVLLRTFWRQVNLHFESKEAREIVSLIAFFLGRTPFDTNAVYTLLSHIEFTHTGYYNVNGGMYSIVNNMVKVLVEKGAIFHYNTEIVDYKSNGETLISLIDKNGHEWDADIFVINADAALFRGSVFKRKNFSPRKLSKMKWTMGYLTLYLGIKTKLPQVEHHNYYLGTNYNAYSRSIEMQPGTLEKPYYYVNVVSKHNASCAPEGCEALFFVCPVPNLLHKKHWKDKQEIANSIINDFSERIHQDLGKDIVSLTIFTPEDWGRMFNLYKGSGLGLAHNMMQIGAFRPKNFDEVFRNTFYVGASTVPGAGLPMAVISSKLCFDRIVKHATAPISI